MTEDYTASWRLTQEALAENPSLRLIRNSHAPFILTFLHASFKENQEGTLPSDLLAGKLAQFLENSGLPEEAVPAWKGSAYPRAEALLDLWCREENKFLRRFADEEGTVLVELTPYTERVFQWVEALEETDLVGTESRFGEILRRLDELLDHSNPDPQAALRRLEEKKRALEEEIRRVKETGQVKQFTDLQVEERFKSLNRLCRELLGDFKQVEANFKAIVKEIYTRQAGDHFSRGDILGYTLDATEQLRRSPQGQSFYSFWEFLIQDTGKETLRHKVEELWTRLEEKNLPHRDEVLRNLKTYLHQAGRRVIAGNHLLAEKLNRLLTEKERSRREKTLGLLRDIRDAALSLPVRPQDGTVFWRPQGDPEVTMIMNRPLSDPPKPRNFNQKPSRPSAPPPREGLEELAGQFYVDTLKLKNRVTQALRTSSQTSLEDLLKDFPPEQGLSEVLAYFSLASQDPESLFDTQASLEIPLGAGKALAGPRVLFRNPPGQETPD